MKMYESDQPTVKMDEAIYRNLHEREGAIEDHRLASPGLSRGVKR